MTHSIEHRLESHAFITIVDGKESLLRYRVVGTDGKTLEYYHTFVPPELRGRHIAQEIVKYALDFAKENHLHIIPSCPYVKAYIDQHPEYEDLLP